MPCGMFMPAESEPYASGEVGQRAASKCDFAHGVPQPLTRRFASASPQGETAESPSLVGRRNGEGQSPHSVSANQ